MVNASDVMINNQQIKPLETIYKGHRFRSRLEARWAVFFEELGCRWEYEPQGYALPCGNYLPDFFIHLPDAFPYPNAGYWVEIKGQTPTPLEIERCRQLATGTKHTVNLFVGLIGDTKGERYWFHNNRGEWHFTGLDGDPIWIMSAIVAHCGNCNDWGQAARDAARAARFGT